jgi:uncharacterized protein (UPF0333 family)
VQIKRRGQSILEYVVLLAVILSALLLMHIYVKRSYQGRLKEEASQLGQQYSPGHTTSTTYSGISSKSTTCTGGNCFGKTVPQGMTVTKTEVNVSTERKEAVDAFATDN